MKSLTEERLFVYLMTHFQPPSLRSDRWIEPDLLIINWIRCGRLVVVHVYGRYCSKHFPEGWVKSWNTSNGVADFLS
jgi:hypothetical protein